MPALTPASINSSICALAMWAIAPATGVREAVAHGVPFTGGRLIVSEVERNRQR